VLVTGGAGFIGSHVAERLVTRQHDVVIVDDLNDYYDPTLKRGNLETVSRAGPLVFHEVDICDVERIGQLVKTCRPDVIVHLAARAGVRPSIEQPLLYERVNVHGTIGLLEAARRTGVARFIFASSSSVYGTTSRVPFREDDHDLRPISPYAATKLAGEAIAYTYSHLYDLPVVCLRFFTVYGPRQRPDLAIRKFVERILRDEPVPMFGDGDTGRDYTFISDIVDGIEASLRWTASPYEIFNLGNSYPVQLLTLIRTIERVLGRPATIERLPPQSGDVPLTWADTSKAKRLLGWQAHTSLEEGLAHFVEWLLTKGRDREV
jgi:UDP-glucuronate 4-epimerase